MDAIWQDRWNALQQQLDAQLHTYSSSSNPLIKDSLHSLTDCLKSFGMDQFNFFWEGFDSEQLLPSMVYPQEYVLRATLDQIAFDLSIIQRIASQRQQAGVQQVLEKADKLAQLALNVAISNGILPTCTVLTYFNKSINIRLIPYAPVALIGIPFTVTEADNDFLAIPHEIGHYVYHHAPGLAAELHARIPLYPDWANRWLEEIFADLFGALVAGPVIGLSFQDILLDNSQEKFVADDGEHPPDAVRPYGYSHVLNHLGYTQAAAALSKRWDDMLAQRHYPTQFVPHGGDTAVSFTEAQTLIEKTAVIFLEYLQNERQLDQPNPWSDDSNDLEELSNNFATWLTHPINVNLHKLVSNGNQVGLQANGTGLKNVRIKGHTQTWRDWFKAETRRNPANLLPAQAWVPIFTSGYWPVRGPEGNSDGGL